MLMLRRSPRLRLVATASLVALAVVTFAGPAVAREAPRPSAKARMICADEAQEDLAGVLAVKAKVSAPTWRNRTYACTYRYRSGSFDISVLELPKIAMATTEFTRLSAEPTVTNPDLGMADGSFLRSDGTVVVRTDRRILEVDPTRLPEAFGKLRLTRAALGRTVATVILRCWKG
jgi:hypothetical protein